MRERMSQPYLRLEDYSLETSTSLSILSGMLYSSSPHSLVARELLLNRIKCDALLREGCKSDYFVFGAGNPEHPTHTKFGGVPSRSPDIPWPHDRMGYPYRFLFQWNFSDS